MLLIAWIAASLLLLCPAQTWREPLASMTSGFVTCITNFLIIIRITYPTPICRTAPSTLSRGVSRFAKIASIPRGSINSVHKRRVIAAIAAHRSVPDFFNELWCKNSPEPILIDARWTPRTFCSQSRIPYHLPIYLLVNWVWNIFVWPEEQRSKMGFLWTWMFLSELSHDVIT